MGEDRGRARVGDKCNVDPETDLRAHYPLPRIALEEFLPYSIPCPSCYVLHAKTGRCYNKKCGSGT